MNDSMDSSFSAISLSVLMDSFSDRIWTFLIRQQPQFAIYRGIDNDTATDLDSFSLKTIATENVRIFVLYK